MSHTSMILTALMTVVMILFIAPSVIAFSQGKALRNIALWLAVFLGLALIYQNFGPNSPHPLFQQPEAFRGMKNGMSAAPKNEGQQESPPANKDKDSFTPPSE